jgi:hypothetical protein
MISNGNIAQYLGSRANINMASNYRSPRRPHAKRNLLNYKAVKARRGGGVNYDAVGMRYQKPTPYPRAQRNIGTRYRRPESMPKHRQDPWNTRDWIFARAPTLITSQTRQQRFSRPPPERWFTFPGPIGLYHGDHLRRGRAGLRRSGYFHIRVQMTVSVDAMGSPFCPKTNAKGMFANRPSRVSAAETTPHSW